jgi:hypothetical protein
LNLQGDRVVVIVISEHDERWAASTAGRKVGIGVLWEMDGLVVLNLCTFEVEADTLMKLVD